eukprot:2052379-Rhodomonas_salina.2
MEMTLCQSKQGVGFTCLRTEKVDVTEDEHMHGSTAWMLKITNANSHSSAMMRDNNIRQRQCQRSNSAAVRLASEQTQDHEALRKGISPLGS